MLLLAAIYAPGLGVGVVGHTAMEVCYPKKVFGGAAGEGQVALLRGTHWQLYRYKVGGGPTRQQRRSSALQAAFDLGGRRDPGLLDRMKDAQRAT